MKYLVKLLKPDNNVVICPTMISLNSKYKRCEINVFRTSTHCVM